MLAFNRRYDRSFAAVHARTAAGEIGRLEQLDHHQQRPQTPSPKEYVTHLGWHLPGHDHPRLRHGPVLSTPTSSRCTRTAPTSSRPTSPRRATSTAPWSCCAPRTVPSRTSPTAAAAVFGYDQRIEAFGEHRHAERREPAADQRAVRHRRPLRGRRAVPELLPTSATARPTAPSWTTSSPRSRTTRRPRRPSMMAGPR